MKKWATFFLLYQWSRNPRYGNLEHLPVEGGLLEQPAATMDALTVLVIQYQNALSEQLKASVPHIPKK